LDNLAVRTRLEGNPVSFISTDTIRAGAIEQLSTYAKLLKAEFRSAGDLVKFLETVRSTNANAQLLIDTAGVNPHNAEDLNRLADFTDAVQVELILVMAAGGDASEAVELAAAFQTMKPARLLITRLDMVKRLGSILAAADASGLPFCDVSLTPDIASGLRAINPVSLARLLLPEHARESSNQSETLQATGSS
jgi:flagellar biosynthesis protein FlhF